MWLVGLFCIQTATASQNASNTNVYPNAYLLMSDKDLQIELAQAIHAMYNFAFDEAEQLLNQSYKKHANHPFIAFIIGLNEWWRITTVDETTDYDEKLIQQMDHVIYLAKQLYKKEPHNYEAVFYMTTAYALKGQLYFQRNKLVKAAIAAKNALNYFKKIHDKKPIDTEILLGDALYNYYSTFLYDQYKIVRPFIRLMGKGDKQQGMLQLRKVAKEAKYTHIEAQAALLYILTDNERSEESLQESIKLVEHLSMTYPNNPIFEVYYAKICYLTGQYNKSMQVAKDILHKVACKKLGYNAFIGRNASYFLGHIHYMYRDNNTKQLTQEANKLLCKKIKKYYLDVKKFAETKKSAMQSIYYYYALSDLGKLAEEEGNAKLAKYYYQQLIRTSKNTNYVLNQEAKQRIRHLNKKCKKRTKYMLAN